MRKDKYNLIAVTIFFIILSIFLYGKSGNMLIDFSRESYIPYQILSSGNGNDVFLIYGPFGYFLNTLLYKLTVNINLLLIESLMVAYTISIIFYYIIKHFTIKTIALFSTLFFITVSIFSNSAFSFAVPYSYSTLWAIFGIYIIIFSYLYKKEKLRYITLGFIALNKVELFVLCFIFILLNDIYTKNFKIKNYILSFGIVAIGYSVFLYCKLYFNFDILHNMLGANSLKYLYKGMGTFFDMGYLSYNLAHLSVCTIVSFISYKIFNKNKLISIAVILLLFIFINPQNIFQLGIFIAILLSIINRNKLKKYDILYLFFSTVLCLKAIFALNSMTYSNFGYVLILFYIFRQLSFLINKKWLVYYFSIFILTTSFLQIKNYIVYPKLKLSTEIGTLNLYKSDLELVKKTNDFIKNNISKNENLIIIPEGQIINLINHKNWQFYNSTFTPLDFETFGEKNLIEKLKEYKTDYVVFYPRETSDYGAKDICKDYGVDFCIYIKDNYKQIKEIGTKRKVLIYNINEK